MIHIGILAALPAFPAVIGISRLPLVGDIWQPCPETGGHGFSLCGVPYPVYAFSRRKCATLVPGSGLPMVQRCFDFARHDRIFGRGGDASGASGVQGIDLQSNSRAQDACCVFRASHEFRPLCWSDLRRTGPCGQFPVETTRTSSRGRPPVTAARANRPRRLAAIWPTDAKYAARVQHSGLHMAVPQDGRGAPVTEIAASIRRTRYAETG